jgi:hypothetical protein
MTSPDPGRAARLTAIAERAEKLARWADEDVNETARDARLYAMRQPQAVDESDLRKWAAMMEEAAADIEFLSAHVETLEREKAELTEQRDSWRELRNTLALPALARAEQAEQARDTAHAALRAIDACSVSRSGSFCVNCRNILDAALKSAPAQETER